MGSSELNILLDEFCKKIGWKTRTTLQNAVLNCASQGGSFLFKVPEEGGGKIGAFTLYIFNKFLQARPNQFIAYILISEKKLDSIMQQINPFGREFGLGCIKITSPSSLDNDIREKLQILVLADIYLLDETEKNAVLNKLEDWKLQTEDMLVFSSSEMGNQFVQLLNGFERIEVMDTSLSCEDCYYIAPENEKLAILLNILRGMPDGDTQLVLIFITRHDVLPLKWVLQNFGEKTFAIEADDMNHGLDDLCNLKDAFRNEGMGRLVLICPEDGKGFDLPAADVGINFTIPNAEGYEWRRSRIGSEHGTLITIVEDTIASNLPNITQRHLKRNELSDESSVFKTEDVNRIFREAEEKLHEVRFDPSKYVVYEEFDEESLNKMYQTEMP